MIIAGTGHRPEKLGGYDYKVEQLLARLATEFLTATRPEAVISGMALGWDTALASAAIELEIPLVAAIPFIGQESAWPERSRARYHTLLTLAGEVYCVTKGGYSPAAMQRRNEWMVDHSDYLVALWDGSRGGTANCVAYAARQHRDGWNLWPHYVDAAVNLGLLSGPL